MNIHAALLMIDFVCENRHAIRNDHMRRELLEAISELADASVEAVRALNDPVQWGHCQSEIELVVDFVEEALKTGSLEYGFSNVQNVSLRAIPSPGDTQ